MIKFSLSLRKDKLNRTEQLFVLQQLYLLLKNGFSLNDSLNLMPDLFQEKQSALKQLRQDFSVNQNLDGPLRKLGYSPHIATQLEMSLEQGTLLLCLEQLTRLLKVKNEQMKKVGQELAYPLVIMTLMGGLLIFMKIFLADFTQEFQTTGQNLIFWFGALVFLSTMGIFSWWFYQTIRTENFKNLKFLARLPFIGETIKSYINYLVAFNIAILVGNGFSIQKICDFCQQQDEKSLQYQLGKTTAAHLAKGVSIKEIIKREVFLPKQLQLATNSGNNQAELKRQLVFIQENIFLTLIQKLSRLCLRIQPICFVLIGVGVLTMYLKLLLPMYSVMQTI